MAKVIIVLFKSFKNLQKQPAEVFFKKGVLRNFTKFTGKHLCKSLFLYKVAGMRPAKRGSGTGVFLGIL